MRPQIIAQDSSDSNFVLLAVENYTVLLKFFHVIHKRFNYTIHAVQFHILLKCQGANVNGSAMQTGTKELNELFEANVTVIAESVSTLMGANAINEGGRVVILSSLWEQFTRQEKFAYSVTKAAVGGLVRSLAVDLGRQKKILVNGILPGIVNSPMVARTLSPEQIANVLSQTPIGELATPADVANSVYMFGSALNTGISGQSIFVDRGFSVARTI